MELRRKSSFEAQVSSSSLSDIMFFLMLFFLIMSTMISPSVIKLTLPSAKNHQTVRKTEVAVSITKDLKYFVNNKAVTLANLEPELVKVIAKSPDATIVLRCDYAVSVQNLVDVLQIGNKLKVKMILATKSPNG
jgi:biopolymer transport protein ExbD